MKLNALYKRGIIGEDDIRLLSRLDVAIHGRGRNEMSERVDVSRANASTPTRDLIARKLFSEMPTENFAILIDLISGASVSATKAAFALQIARGIA